MPKKAAGKEKKAKKEKEKTAEVPEFPGIPPKNPVVYASVRPFDPNSLVEYEPSVMLSVLEDGTPAGMATSSGQSFAPVPLLSSFSPGGSQLSHCASSSTGHHQMSFPILSINAFSAPSLFSLPPGYELRPGRQAEMSQTTTPLELLLQSPQLPVGLQAVQGMANLVLLNGFNDRQLKRELESLIRLRGIRRGGNFIAASFIIDDMRCNAHSLPIQVAGCRALLALCLSTHTTSDLCKREPGVCDCRALFSTKSTLPDAITVQLSSTSSGVGAMSDISSIEKNSATVMANATWSKAVGDPEANRASIVEAGAVDLLLVAINTFSVHVELLIAAFDLLTQLALQLDLMQLMRKKGLLDRVVALLRIFAPSPTNAAAAKNPQIILSPQQQPLFVQLAQAAAAAASATPAAAPIPLAAQPSASVSSSLMGAGNDLAKQLQASRGLLDTLRFCRRCYDTSVPEHRLVERLYAVMSYTATTSDFAGPVPGGEAVVVDDGKAAKPSAKAAPKKDKKK